MITLNKNGDSIVALTLSERSKLDNPYYTFLVDSKERNFEYFFNALDISSNPKVYNKFIITVVQSNPDISLGKIILPVGEYNYYVYEKTTLGDFIIGECEQPLEKGILRVEGDGILTTIAPNRNQTINVAPRINR